jgi:energy-coupling factor transporter transmembrane protein EcfT
MLQRIQSLWLLLAAVCAFLTFQFSFYTGNILENENLVLKTMTALGLTSKTDAGKTEYNIVSLLLTSAVGITTLIAIFMYATRKVQLRITITAMLLSILTLVYLFILTKDFSDGTLSLASIFAFLPPVFLFLASRGIYKDEKLVKSMDRLR